MPLSEYQVVSIEDFGGEITRLDESNIPLNQAQRARNVEFNPGQVATRFGFAQAKNADGTNFIPAWLPHYLVSWVTTGGNYAIAYTRDGDGLDPTATGRLSVINLADGIESTAIIVGAVNIGVTVASAAIYAYGAFYNIDVTSNSVDGTVTGGYIFGPSGTFTDQLFLYPLFNKPTLTTTGPGHVVTPGVHRVGYLIQTRAGYTGRISPVNLTTDSFDTTSVVTVAAGEEIGFSLTVNFPTESSLVYPVMTTVDNPDRYFIVPGIAPVAVSGGIHTVIFVIDIDDADLASTGTDITDNQFLLTRSAVSGLPPFDPFGIINFGTRVVYLTNISGVSQAYASEPNNGQQITADQNVLFLPGQRLMRTAGTLGRILYILGPHWTYSYEDTGDVPVLWPAPRLVDGSIGTLSTYGFTIDATTGVGWCADTSGLYAFEGGAYQSLPCSYLCNYDWNRINWLNGQYMATAPTVLQLPAEPVKVIDDKDKKRVMVIAPLKSNSTVNTSGTSVTWASGDEFPVGMPINNLATQACIVINGVGYIIASIPTTTTMTLTGSAGTQTGVTAVITPISPTDILVFDYSDGNGFDTVKYSRWYFDQFAPGGGAMMQNPKTGTREFWMGRWGSTSTDPSGPYTVRQMNTREDTAPYGDIGHAIDSQWEGALMPGMGGDPGQIYYHYAEQTRVTGAGTLARTLYGLDHTSSVALTNLTLAASPGVAYTTRFPRLRSEGASIRYKTNTLNDHFILSGLDHFFQKGPSRR